MDATMLAVFGTGLTAIGTAIALFTALWRVQGNRFDALERHVDKQFEGVDKRFEGVDKQFEGVDKRFEGVDKQFEGVDKRFEGVDKQFEGVDKQLAAADKRWTERFEMAERASRERFEMAERASRERFEAMEQRFETVERQTQATHAAVCALNGRFDDLYRHLLAAPPRGGRPDAADE